MIYQNPFFWAILVLFGIILGYFIRQLIAVRQASSVEQKTKTQIVDAKSKAKQLILEAQEKATALLEEIKKEEREVKARVSRLEERLMQKEEAIEAQAIELKTKEEQIDEDIEKIKSAKSQIEDLKQRVNIEIEKIARLSVAEAKDLLFKKIKNQFAEELLLEIRKLEKERKEELEKKSLAIMTAAIQRYARSHVSEVTTTLFNLGNEDLKGKIIGREGRNIRALERATGVEFIIDETPDSVVISSFDPIRREIARMALEKLIKDGRIQPAKIEEKVEEARQELMNKINEIFVFSPL